MDFSKYYLIVGTVLSAKPTYSVEYDIESCYINKNKIELEYKQALNPIYVQNIDNIDHINVNIIRINKDIIPTDIENIYKE